MRNEQVRLSFVDEMSTWVGLRRRDFASSNAQIFSILAR